MHSFLFCFLFFCFVVVARMDLIFLVSLLWTDCSPFLFSIKNLFKLYMYIYMFFFYYYEIIHMSIAWGYGIIFLSFLLCFTSQISFFQTEKKKKCY